MLMSWDSAKITYGFEISAFDNSKKKKNYNQSVEGTVLIVK